MWYRLIFDSNRYASVALWRKRAVDWAVRMDGRPRAAGWKPLKLDWDRSGALDAGDFSHLFAHLPIVSLRALDALEDLWSPHAERLPVELPPAPGEADPSPRALLHVTRVLDALDRDASELDTWGDLILHVHRYALRPEVLGDVPVFRIVNYAVSGVFVSEAFRARVVEAGLTGLLWEPLPGLEGALPAAAPGT